MVEKEVEQEEEQQQRPRKWREATTAPRRPRPGRSPYNLQYTLWLRLGSDAGARCFITEQNRQPQRLNYWSA